MAITNVEDFPWPPIKEGDECHQAEMKFFLLLLFFSALSILLHIHFNFVLFSLLWTFLLYLRISITLHLKSKSSTHFFDINAPPHLYLLRSLIEQTPNNRILFSSQCTETATSSLYFTSPSWELPQPFWRAMIWVAHPSPWSPLLQTAMFAGRSPPSRAFLSPLIRVSLSLPVS